MEKKDFDIDNFVLGFYEGCKFAVEAGLQYVASRSKEIDKETANIAQIGKNKELKLAQRGMNELVEALKIGVAAVGKENIRKAAEDFYESKRIREEIMGRKESQSGIKIASQRQIDKLGKE